MFKEACVIGLLTAFLSGCADLPTAERAFEQGDTATAERHWKNLAARGFPQAQYGMGRLNDLQQGDGNNETALNYYLAAYSNGYEPAAYQIGKHYLQHAQGNDDYMTAYDWFVKAAQAGSVGARLALADMQLQGQGTPQNLHGALSTYEELSNQGNASASRQLARIYENGEYLPTNYDLALSYYQKAITQGDEASEIDIARFYAQGLAVDADLEKAKQLYLTHAQKGNAKAAYELAKLYELNTTPEEKLAPQQAVRWYRAAASQGYTWAKLRLADLLLEGLGVEQNVEAAIQLLEDLSAQGIPSASRRLASIYESDSITTPDYSKALGYYQLALEQGDSASELKLARFYADGLGIEQDYKKARAIYLPYANNGDIDAAYSLGKLYEQEAVTLGKSQSPEAQRWYRQAAEGNHEGAQLRLADLLLETNTNESRQLLERLSSNGNGAASYRLGRLYSEEKIIAANLTKAKHYYELALKQSYPQAELKLAALYAKASTNRERQRAIEIYRNHAQAGDAESAYQLALLLETLGAPPSKITYWLEKASAGNHGEARLYYGEKLFAGLNSAPDPTTGLTLVLMAARQGVSGAVSTGLIMMESMTVDQIDQANRLSRQRLKLP